MTLAELDALAETVRQCHANLIPMPWESSSRDFRGQEHPTHWYVTGDIKEADDEDEDGEPCKMSVGLAVVLGNLTSGLIPEQNATGIAAVRNALPAILAALAQAKTDREEVEALKAELDWAGEPEAVEGVAATILQSELAALRAENERLRMANDTLELHNRRLRLRHDPNCDSIGESSETEPKPCNCYLHAMSQNGQLHAENERLVAGLARIEEYAQLGIGNDEEACEDATDHIRVREACRNLLAARPATAKEGT